MHQPDPSDGVGGITQVLLHVLRDAERHLQRPGGHRPPGNVLQWYLQNPSNRAAPPHTNESLTHIDFYMDGIISAVQGGPDRHDKFFDGTVCALKWLFLSLTGESNDLVRVKRILAGEGDWACVKEVLGWTLYTEVGMPPLLGRKLWELITLVDISVTQYRMGRKDLERLVGNLCSMHLAVPGEVAHLFYIQCALNHGGVERACLLPEFHFKISDWRLLVLQAAARPTHLSEIVRRKPTHLGFYNASGLGEGEFWLDPYRTGHNLV